MIITPEPSWGWPFDDGSNFSLVNSCLPSAHPMSEKHDLFASELTFLLLYVDPVLPRPSKTFFRESR